MPYFFFAAATVMTQSKPVLLCAPTFMPFRSAIVLAGESTGTMMLLT